MRCSLAHVFHGAFLRFLGLTIAVVLLLAFVERPSSLSLSSDPRLRSPHLNPPCGATESVELLCLIIFSLDIAVKVTSTRRRILYLTTSFSVYSICYIFRNLKYIPKNGAVLYFVAAFHFLSFFLFFYLTLQSYLIGWEEFRKNKWLISYLVVISFSFIDWMLSVSMVCDEVRLCSVIKTKKTHLYLTQCV